MIFTMVNKPTLYLTLLFLMLLQFQATQAQHQLAVTKSPNILFVIADDQSFPYANAYGKCGIETPAFDKVANNGILFMNAFVAAPQCSPSRAAILTGRNIWQLEEAGTHDSYFPKKFPVFTDALENAGYQIGYTGKAWDPGNFEDAGWPRNPVGPEYNTRKLENPPTKGINKTDYAANFADFLAEKPKAKPFFFWFGAHEPHRVYEAGSGKKAGLNPNNIIVPPFLPDNDLVRNDLIDYALEIQWFDKQLGNIMKQLDDAGELKNTIIIITADNGMAFPYAKANMQEYGIHVPLAICGPTIKGKNRKVTDLVSLIDLSPTILEWAGLPHLKGTTGKSLLPIMQSNKSGNIDASRQYILAGRERHTHARPDNLGYPSRAIRTAEYLYIKNFKPNRWPLGDPPSMNPIAFKGDKDMKPIVEGYEDIDASPTKTFIINNQYDWKKLFQLGFAKREADQLYNIKEDPYCMIDLANSTKHQIVLKKLQQQLEKELIAQGDPRALGNGAIFDTYPRFGLMRPFDGFKERGQYNKTPIND
jgi:uncharacterized sulfatase